MWTRREQQNIVRFSEGLTEAPDVDRLGRWILGVVVPLIPLALGIYWITIGRAWLIADGGLVELSGSTALAAGIAWVAVAVFAHSHWFWCPHYIWCGVGELGKILSLVVLIVSATYVAFGYAVFT